MSKMLIGTLYLNKDTEFTRLYETASWYTVIKVSAGNYPVFFDTNWGNGYVTVPMGGIVTKSHFENRVFMSAHSVHNQDVGKKDTYVLGMRASNFARAIAENRYDVTLDIDLVRVTSKDCEYKGEIHKIYDLELVRK